MKERHPSPTTQLLLQQRKHSRALSAPPQVQCSSAPSSAMQCRTAHRCAVQCSAAQHIAVLCSAVPHSTSPCSAVQCSAASGSGSASLPPTWAEGRTRCAPSIESHEGPLMRRLTRRCSRALEGGGGRGRRDASCGRIKGRTEGTLRAKNGNEAEKEREGSTHGEATRKAPSWGSKCR